MLLKLASGCNFEFSASAVAVACTLVSFAELLMAVIDG